MDIRQRFFNYIAIDTKSDPESETCPSSKNQLDLGRLLLEELKAFGLNDARMDEYGYVYASLKGNVENVPTIGFIAHMDTSPDLDGKVTNPKVTDYKGGDLRLSDEYVMTEEEFPELKKLKGETLITTDGTTLLGADDKAGIAIIMDGIQYLIEHPEIKRGDVKIAFTPDEEIGRGAHKFDVKGFNADFAYTFDGGPIGELEYENFNAASVKIEIKGKNVHPGSAKNAMINSQLIAMELHNMLPVNERPEYTEGYEGFYLLTDINGTVDFTKMAYIIRDHSSQKFEEKKKYMEELVSFLNKKYRDSIKVEIKDSYKNMKEKIVDRMEIVDLAKKSMEDLNIKPIIRAIRGGTDGATLSFMGLPCPNLFAGGYNFHSRFEFIPDSSLRLGSKLLVKILENNAK